MDSAQVLTVASALGASHECTPHMLITRLRGMQTLELHARCEARIRNEHLFLSVARLEARALARISYRALVDEMPSSLSEWIEHQVEQAAVELMTEDLLVQTHHRSAGEFPDIAPLLGLEPHHSQMACAQLNLLPIEMRRTCTRLFFGADTIRNCASDLGISSPELKERIEAILLTIHRLTFDGNGTDPA